MKSIFKITAGLLLIIAITYCFNSLFASPKIVDNLVLNNGDTVVKKFHRHGLVYIDKKVNNQIVSRYVYQGEELLYKYPITKENAGKGTIELESGNTFIRTGVADTIRFTNYHLPPMNKYVYLRNGILTRLSDSSYIIKSNSKSQTFVTFIISASVNYEEIKNRQSIVIDSLMLPVR